MVERTVLHGTDQSGLTVSRPTNANHGHVFWDDNLRTLLVWDSNLKMYLPTNGAALYSAASPRELFDDFAGSVLSDIWTVNSGSDAQALDPVLDTDNVLSELFGVTGNAGTGTAADATSITGPLAFEAEEGELIMVARFKISAITNVAFFVGFTDVLASTLELPVSLSVATYTTNATDACGIMFDTAATTDTMRLVGVDSDVDATHADTSVAPVADTYLDVKIVVSTAGAMTVTIDGIEYAAVAAAVSPGVDICPIVVAEARTTTSRTITVDHIGVT